jgi:tRNA(His) guanylyltransferase
MSLVVSTFSAAYVFHWNEYFPEKKLIEPPTFDGRWVEYTSYQSIRDYMSWRQADCHVNNQYNYTFWCLVKSGLSHQEAQATLKGTVTAEKNEILFGQFEINYNNLPAGHKKGSIVFRKKAKSTGTEVQHVDIIQDSFWDDKNWLLGENPAKVSGKSRSKENTSRREKKEKFRNENKSSVVTKNPENESSVNTKNPDIDNLKISN